MAAAKRKLISLYKNSLDEEVPEGLTHSDSTLFVGEFLEHYGIRGMHWGVRRSRPSPVATAPKATSVVPHGEKKKTKIQTEGGENHPAHSDAIKVAEARTKLAKSGPAALSNQELREVATRLQLETQVAQMTTPAARKFVTNLLRQQGQQQTSQLLNTQVKRATKKAA
jgi:hypothetical protein